MATDDEHSETKFREKFEKRIKDTALDTLPAFIAEMLAEPLDYGTICLACAFAGAAASWAVERSPQGGITGFQAGCIGWELLRQWGSPGLGETGTRLINYDDLLYPQYADKFRAISAHTWKAVQEKAREKVAQIGSADEHGGTHGAHPSVVAHWKAVANGAVPFGLIVEAA